MNWITKEIIQGTIQILGSGVGIIGATNMGLLLLAAWHQNHSLSDFYPMQITMAFPTALALFMTSICIVLLTVRVKPKTRYHNGPPPEAESP